MSVATTATKVSTDGGQQPALETLSPTSVGASSPYSLTSDANASRVSTQDDVDTSASCNQGGKNCTSTVLDGSESNNDDLMSPTSVTMVCSSSSASLLPTAAASVPPTPPNSSAVKMIPKPFFVMDWLEDINPRDLELARKMLNTPKKKQLFQHKPCERSKSTPTLSGTGSSSCPRHPRSSINLPTLSHKDDGSVCRQLYPAAAAAAAAAGPSTPDAAPSNSITTNATNDDIEIAAAPTSINRTTSATSVSTVGSASVTVPAGNSSSNDRPAATTPRKASTPVMAKMSPFKRRSIAIGNGWNTKGLHKAKKGSWEAALACWENALEIRTQVLGKTHPDVANTCNNMGIALGKLGRYDAAIEVLEKALELRAKHFGSREHVEVAATLHNIGNVLHAAQDCAGAIQCFWDAKLLQEQLLGPDHVQVARACVAIANVYHEAQQYDDAREAYYDALQVFVNAGLSDRHPEVLAIQQDLQDIDKICHAWMMRQQQHQHQHQHEQYQYYHPEAVASNHLQQQQHMIEHYYSPKQLRRLLSEQPRAYAHLIDIDSGLEEDLKTASGGPSTHVTDARLSLRAINDVIVTSYVTS